MDDQQQTQSQTRQHTFISPQTGLFVLLAVIAVVAAVAIVISKVVRNRRTIDLVIARYAEDLGWLQSLDLGKFRNVIVYNKGDTEIENLNLRENVRVVKLPNVGRCDHTYIHHIVENYHSLAAVTIFLPGSCSMDRKWENAKRTVDLASSTYNSVFIGSKFDEGVDKQWAGFQLDDWQASNDHNRLANPETKLLRSPQRPFGTWYHKNFPGIHVQTVVFSGIFAVHRNHARHRTLGSYKELLSYVDHHSNPEAGHYIERAWLAIFDPVPDVCVVNP